MASEWNAGTYYLPGQQAIVASIIYTATSIQPNHNRNPPSSPTWWNVATNFSVVVSATPEEWNAGTFYLPNQEVQWLSILYKATPVQPNRGRQPNNNPSWWLPSQTPGVTQIVAGSNITISPTNGLGAVTINATGSNLVTSVSGSNAGISVSPTTGNVIIRNTGVTSIAVAGSGLATSGSAGALTLTATPQWVGTATSILNMNGYAIQGVGDVFSPGNIAIYTNSGHYAGFYQGVSYIQIDPSQSVNLWAPTVNINNINIVNSGTGWTTGVTHTIYGDVLNGDKYIKWSYNNNPGTQIADNSSINLTSPYIKLDRTGGGSLVLDTNVDLNCATGHFLTIGNFGGSFFQIQSGGAQVLTTPTGQDMTLTAGGNLVLSTPNQTYFNNGGFVQFNVDHISMFRGYLDMLNHPIYMGNATIYNAGELYNNNTDLLLTGIGRNIILQATTTGKNIQLTSDTIVNTTSANYYITATGSAELRASFFNFWNDCYFNNRSLYNITNLNFISGNISTGSTYTDIHGGGLGSYLSLINGSSYVSIDTVGNNTVYSSKILGLRASSNVYIQSDSSYIELIPNGGAGTIYHSAGYTEFRGNAGFTQSNSYITGLGHIYGNTSASGGGLTIDYMYGMFFNSGSNNANLYASGGTLNMTNYNGATNINNYNPVGTGDLILYSDKTNLVLSAGTGNVITNSHDTVYINSYVGDINLQTITAGKNINLISTNINITGNTYVNSGYLQMNDNPIRLRSDQYHALAFGNAGTYNVGVNGPFLVGYNGGALGTSGTSFNNKSLEWSYTDVYIYKRLDMCNNNIINVNNLYSAGNFNIYAPTGLGIGLNNNTYFNNFTLGDVGRINMTSGGTINLNNGPITNAGNVIIGSSYSLDMSTAPIKNVGAFGRTLASTNVNQPVIQYGVATGSGVSGSVSVTIPTTYTSTSSYVVQVTMRDSPTAQLYATPTSANTFTIGWTSAGTGTQNIMWTTFGS